jgi:hypothetical protein
VLVVLLLLCVVFAFVAAAWSARRHRQMASWHRELDSAFASGERRELPGRRRL